MKTYDTENIRNVCLIGHSGAGKTSLSEVFLFNSGAINRIGKISEGNTVSDSLPEEIRHHVSISSSLLPIEQGKYKVNVLDTPGYSDFIGEVTGVIRVVESAVLVLCGVSGVEVQAEIVWEMLEEQKLPRTVFINKLDRENAGSDKVFAQLKSLYPEHHFVQLHIPIGTESNFVGIVDVLSRQAYYYAKDGSGKCSIKEIPAELQDEVELIREGLAEMVAEADDEILMNYLEGIPLTDEELTRAFHLAYAQNLITPVLCGSAFKNIAVTALFDFLRDHAPSPSVHPEKAALVFKTLADPYVGKMNFFRVYGGTFSGDSFVYNANREIEEKMGQPFCLRGKMQIPVPPVIAGDMAVIAKAQDIRTGDTLCKKEKPLILPGIKFPEPRLAVAIVPKSKGDEDKLGNALVRLCEEDLTMKIEKNLETKELILTGMGEMHLEILMEKLARKFGVAVNIRLPRVPYRETIQKTVKVEGKHKKQSGGHGQYGHVWINMEPLKEGEFEFAEEVFGGAVPRQYFPAVEKGIREAMNSGILAGYPVTNIKVVLYDGSYHSVDSSEMAFKLASIIAFRKGAEAASPVLLEPMLEAEIRVPEVFMGDVIGDLNSKRGRVLGMEAEGRMQVIKAYVPQAEMLRYAVDLKSLTQGRGSFKTEFYQYEEIPPRLTSTIVNQLKQVQNE